MVTPELASYIWSRRKEGMSDIIIKANLRTQGWTNEDFDEAAATLPSARTKIDGPMISKLPQNVIWTGQEAHNTKVHARKWKIMIWAVAFGLFIGLAVWLYMNPQVVKSSTDFVINFSMTLYERSMNVINRFKK